MLNPHSVGPDWLSASPSERRAYVVAACRGCSERGVGNAAPEIVLAGLDEYFARPSNLKWSVSHGFGIIFGAVSLGHDYRMLL